MSAVLMVGIALFIGFWLSNESRYAAWETEWAFRFWNKGLNVSVGDKIGRTTSPVKSA